MVLVCVGLGAVAVLAGVVVIVVRRGAAPDRAGAFDDDFVITRPGDEDGAGERGREQSSPRG